MRLSIYKLLLGFTAVFGLAAVGCDEVTTSDVESARENVEEEAEDVREAQEEAREEIAEEQDDVNELAREEGAEIAEEKRELAEAQAEAAKVEKEFATQEQRKAYIETHRTALNDADRNLDTWETDAGKIEDDAARDAREANVKSVRDLYNDANSKFGELDATDEAADWKLAHGAFATAFERMQTALSKLDTAPATDVPATDLPPSEPLEPAVP